MNLIDVSNAQGGSIDWSKVAKDNVQGVWLKATEGLTFDDAFYAANRRRANAAGLRTGAYHFARPENNSAKDEADHFSRVIGKPGRRDLKPVLDMEGKGNEDWAHLFCQRVTKNLGVTPIFYSYSAWLLEHKFKTPVGNGLWLANYDGLLHTVSAPAPWKRYVAHQYTDKGQVDGIGRWVATPQGNVFEHSNVDRSWGRKIGCLAHPVLGL